MAEIRISQITAKSSNLATTDEFAIAESDGSGGFVSKKINGAQLKDSTFSAQTATTYNLVLTDAHKTVTLTNGSAIDARIPTNAGTAFPIGTRIELLQGGAGQVTVAPTGGVTLNSSGGKTKLAAQYAQATILKVATDTWYLFGDITT
mgnify:FL=1|jgi:hypothetical protein|tara:strand:+ start:1203 stop:1646 length:444 start_codon:yes stop_codon:yes gene_type:complete